MAFWDRFLPSPQQGTGLAPAEYRAPIQFQSPDLPESHMIYGQNVNLPFEPIDPLEHQEIGYNNGGIGAFVTTKEVVQEIPVYHHPNVLKSPTSARGECGPLQGASGRQDRVPYGELAAPPKLQSIPGYTLTQYQAQINGEYNSTLNEVYKNLKAPTINSGGNGCRKVS